MEDINNQRDKVFKPRGILTVTGARELLVGRVRALLVGGLGPNSLHDR